jgi:isopenicillin-N N-acyltransferase like protein
VTFPIIQLSGSSFQQGVQHGRDLKSRIGENLEIYFDRFKREAHLEPDEVLERAAKMLDVIQNLNLEYYDGMRGISEGSGFDLLEIAALNVRYEILYYQFGEVALEEHGLAPRERVVDGCTAFAVLPEASSNNQLLIGQNWDWIPDVKGAILHTKHEDGLETLAFTEAGIFGGKLGLNSFGMGLCINGITSMDDDWARPVRPVHVLRNSEISSI